MRFLLCVCNPSLVSVFLSAESEQFCVDCKITYRRWRVLVWFSTVPHPQLVFETGDFHFIIRNVTPFFEFQTEIYFGNKMPTLFVFHVSFSGWWRGGGERKNPSRQGGAQREAPATKTRIRHRSWYRSSSGAKPGETRLACRSYEMLCYAISYGTHWLCWYPICFVVLTMD